MEAERTRDRGDRRRQRQSEQTSQATEGSQTACVEKMEAQIHTQFVGEPLSQQEDRSSTGHWRNRASGWR